METVNMPVTKLHLLDAPQIVINGVEPATSYRLSTPTGEYLGEIKITTTLKAIARFVLLFEFAISLPFKGELFDHEGKKLASFKKPGFFSRKMSFFNKDEKKIGSYKPDIWKTVEVGKLVDAYEKDILHIDWGSKFGDFYFEDVRGNQFVSFKQRTRPEDYKRLFVEEKSPIMQFDKNRTEEEKLMFLMSLALPFWM
jgi:hypothetical protein